MPPWDGSDLSASLQQFRAKAEGRSVGKAHRLAEVRHNGPSYRETWRNVASDVTRLPPHAFQPTLSTSSARRARRFYEESGLSAEEIGTHAWLMICARDSDGVAVNAESGRVFRVAHDDSPCLHLLAPSVDGAAAREQLLAALFRGDPAFIASVLPLAVASRSATARSPPMR